MLKDQKTDKIVNGVNVTAWRETVDAVKADTGLAAFNFRADNRWLGGSLNKTSIAAFYGAGETQDRAAPFFYDNDEPPVLFGTDTSANPAEFLLHALVGCLTTSIAYHAAANDIVVEEMESEISGDMDARPFLNLADDIKPGFITIDAKIRVKTSATADQIKELALFSPIYQTVKNGPVITIEIETY